ncbi:MAG: aldo/keto reductase [Myxococcales bacterium]|nr:aldo/keto reductase [Myxococcales bacterium]MBL0194384.1 aldo/keto reductase [Myxococcales bacterium]HQY62059.1 aldo/keto reductase [Polyangiaceae bacterium]
MTFERVPFGAGGPLVSRVAIASSYGVGGEDLERAYERGVNFFFWGLRRRRSFGAGLRRLAARDRGSVVLAIQSYTRLGFLMRPSVLLALRALRTDYVDVLSLGWWNELPPRRILDAALALRERGMVKQIVISSHERTLLPRMAQLDGVDGVMVRYNAAHPGAEREVFPNLDASPGVLAFTATRWGSLLNPRLVPPGERVPSASDCYRFALTSPHVHATLAGPKDGRELDAALDALDRGPLDPEELAWMRRVGLAVRDDTKAHAAMGMIDRARARLFGATA